MKPPPISVTVKQPDKTVFEGTATAVTSVSARGKFDVLAYHANLIALIEETLIIGQEGKENIVIPIKEGIMKVQKNTIKIILGINTKGTSKIFRDSKRGVS